MFFSKDRCLRCRSPIGRDQTAHPYGFNENGNPPPVAYWFCTDTCLQDEVDERVPEHSRWRSTIYDYPPIKLLLGAADAYEAKDLDRYKGMIDRDKAQWAKEKESDRRLAQWDLKFKIDMEATRHHDEDFAKQQEQWARERDAWAKNEAKLNEKVERTWERVEEKRLAEIHRVYEGAHNEHAEWLAFERSKQALEQPIPNRTRFEHTHVLAGSGFGKTTLLTHQFLADIQTDAAIIVIDGKGTFVEELQRLKLFEDSDRVVVIRPQDAPALNMFVPPEGGQDSAIAMFEYIFAASNFKLTAKQATCLSYCVRLLFSIKGATIHTLLDLLADRVEKNGGIPADSKFKQFIDPQPPIVRRFFSDLFYHPTEFGETKRQIQNRIYDLLENPAFYAMFSASECNLDLGDILRNRKILLVDSSVSALGEKAAQLLGRYIIALALNAAYARLRLPDKEQWTPAYLIVDEAQMFVDEDRTQSLLQQAREFNLGVTLAHQKLDDLTPTLAATFASNTSIRYVGGVSAQDASFMSKNMNCDTDFIMEMERRKTGTTTTFACYVRGLTDRAVPLTITLGALQNAPKMTNAAHDALMKKNRERLTHKAPGEPMVRVVENNQPVAAPAQKPPSLPSSDTPEAGPTW